MTAQTTGQLITIIFLLFVGFVFIVSAYKSAFSRSKPNEQIEKFFSFGLIFVVASVIGFSGLFYRIGLADKKEVRKERVFEVKKKLNNFRAEIQMMDEGDRFVIEGDEVIYLPKSEPAAETSLSDVKKM